MRRQKRDVQPSGLGFRVSLRVHVPNTWVVGFWIIAIIVQALGKYMIFGYLDP